MNEIKRITSFETDHTVMVPGLYISRVDKDITTYDLRTRKPNCEHFMDTCTMHSVEHMFATYIRSSELSEDILYFGPMGCQTGFYLLVRNADNAQVKAVIEDTLKKIISHTGEMFGNTEIECGNYKNLSVEDAKKECRAYLAVLENDTHNFIYPKGETK